MEKRICMALVCAVPLIAACEDITRSPEAERAEEVGEVHEEAAEQRAKEEGQGFFDRQLTGKVARERGELATEAGQGAEGLVDEPAQTAAEDLAEDDWYGKPGDERPASEEGP